MIELHQSELATFRRCRRRWALSSPNMLNLEPEGAAPEALWFGSGFHFALEDYHGWNRFEGLFYAFNAYAQAAKDSRPENWKELHDLAAGMFDHYEHWLSHRDDHETRWTAAIPDVELNWRVPIPGIDPDRAILAGTFDRLVTDPHGRTWILDYKTASRFNVSKLDMDAQVSTYCWAFRELYGYAPEGMIYVQFLKAVPEPPRVLKNGHLSVDKSAPVSWDLFLQAAEERYGEGLKSAPPQIGEHLAWLRDQEDENGDRFIRRDLVRRNEAQLDALGRQLEYQARQVMSLSADPIEWPSLYPNPTVDCGYCPFRSVCLAMDDGSDYQSMLSGACRQREGGNNPWRNNLPEPCAAPKAPADPSSRLLPQALTVELPACSPSWGEAP